MLTKKFADFSADLLDTVRGVLGEAKKCKECGCAKCECEDEDEDEVEEGYVPTADEPSAKDKSTADKVRALLAKEKRLKKESIDPDLENELKATRQTKKSVEDAKKKYAKEEVELDEENKYTVHQGKKGWYVNQHTDNGVWHHAEQTGYHDSKEKAVGWAKKHAGERKHTITVKEEAEQIDELSKGKLATYINKAEDSADDLERKAVKGDDKSWRKMHKRLDSTLKAKHKWINAKEEVEQIDELSKKTLGSYIKKSSGHAAGSAAATAAIASSSNPKVPAKVKRDLRNRLTGISKATDKLTKEEQDFIDSLNDEVVDINELSRELIGRYARRAKDEADYGNPLKSRSKGRMMAQQKRWGDKASWVKPAKVPATEEVEITEAEKNLTGLPKSTAEKNKQYIEVTHLLGHKKKVPVHPTNAYKALNHYRSLESTKSARIVSEETEITEARGRPKKNAGKDFTIHPKTKEKLYHSNPEHMARIEKLQKNGILAKPKTEAGQHIINQLRKASTSMQGGSTIHFTHGDSKHVSAAHASKALDKYAGMKPNEKEDFQKKIGHSHEQLMKHI